MRYETLLEERGSNVSGGQLQRIAIARTLLNKPQLLIMDEATSALDYSTERRVCDNLKEFCIGSTVFFITHRLTTIKNADIIPYRIVNLRVSYSLAPKNMPTSVVSEAATENIGKKTSISILPAI